MGIFSGGYPYAVRIFCNFSILLAGSASVGMVFQNSRHEGGRQAEFLYLSLSWDMAVFRAGQAAESPWHWLERRFCDSMAALLGRCFRGSMGSGILEKAQNIKRYRICEVVR